MTEPTARPYRRRMSAYMELPSRESRLMGALLGMAAMARNPDDPLLVGALGVLSSLRDNHRLVLADVESRWAGLAPDSGRGLNALVRCIPLALWLRGPNDRITTAALYLASAQEEDMDAGLGSALLCQWMRMLYRSRSRNVAWVDALDRTQASLTEIGLEPADTAPFMGAVSSEILAVTHPIAHGLRTAHQALARVNGFEALAESVRHSAVPASVQLIAGAVGGLWFGEEAVRDWMGGPAVPHWLDDELIMVGRRCDEMPRLERWPNQTSASHPLPIATLASASGGQIGLCPCPGVTGLRTSHGDVSRDLPADLDRLAAWGAKHVVCLLRGDSLGDLGLATYQDELSRRGIQFWHLPIIDDDSDQWFQSEWKRLRPVLVRALRSGESILIHALDWHDIPRSLPAELLFESGAEPDLEHAHGMVESAVTLAELDASRFETDE